MKKGLTECTKDEVARIFFAGLIVLILALAFFLLYITEAEAKPMATGTVSLEVVRNDTNETKNESEMNFTLSVVPVMATYDEEGNIIGYTEIEGEVNENGSITYTIPRNPPAQEPEESDINPCAKKWFIPRMWCLLKSLFWSPND